MKKKLILTLMFISHAAISSQENSEISRYKAIYNQLIKQQIQKPKCKIKIKGYKEQNDMKVYSMEALEGLKSDCEKVLKAVAKTEKFPLPKNEDLSNKLLETTIYID
jgi:membrane protein involved in colicin uptake